jgi:hypothetical protein
MSSSKNTKVNGKNRSKIRKNSLKQPIAEKRAKHYTKLSGRQSEI